MDEINFNIAEDVKFLCKNCATYFMYAKDLNFTQKLCV